MSEVERLRKLGAKRITLKTGAYPIRELAMAIRWSSDANIDLLTIDGAPGGTVGLGVGRTVGPCAPRHVRPPSSLALILQWLG